MDEKREITLTVRELGDFAKNIWLNGYSEAKKGHFMVIPKWLMRTYIQKRIEKMFKTHDSPII